MTEQSAPRQYFSQRQGRGPKTAPLPFTTVRRTVVRILDRFWNEGYFQESFGTGAATAPATGGKIGNPHAHFLRTIHREDIWPYWFRGTNDRVPRWQSWDEDTLFDVLEVLHDLVSKPVWAPLFFNADWGQEAFRREMNEVLTLGDPAYEIDHMGQVVGLGPEAFRGLIEATVPSNVDDALVTRKLDGAVARFLARGADDAERRVAVRELADVLEVLRPQVKRHLLSADESALFQIANRFAIRHNNLRQRGDYDGEVWLTWMFYTYLATIHAVLAAVEEERSL